ncbi:MAG: hypothetical protein AAFZ18_09085 [Myxococcota bacterium]
MDWSLAFPFAPGDGLTITTKIGPFASLRATAKVRALEPHLVLDYDFPEQSILVRKLAASAGEAELDTQMGRLKLRLKGQDPVEIPLEARQEGRRVVVELGEPDRKVKLVLSSEGPQSSEIQIAGGVPVPMRGLTARVTLNP